MITNTDRLGYYLVNGEKFYNKTLALMECKKTNHQLQWIFNDDVYGAIDWTISIDTSLSELYRLRAQQLRDSYDHLVLYFSGGADSMNVLHSFIDNGILLDEIVMQRPSMVKMNNIDQSADNFYSEIEYSAKAHLKKYAHKIDPRTAIRESDLASPTIELLQKDNWFELYPMCTNIALPLLGKQYSYANENHIKDLCYKGLKVAQIVGVDKPLVKYDGNNYYAFFNDLSAYHVNFPTEYTASDVFNKHYRIEFFYWTPDMPEIVVKQAQEIKQRAEQNNQIKQILRQTESLSLDQLRATLHPIIYPSKDVEVLFQTKKPNSDIKRKMDDWFWAKLLKLIQSKNKLRLRKNTFFISELKLLIVQYKF